MQGYSKEKQQEYLLRISDVLRTAITPTDTEERVSQTVMEYFNADRCYFCSVQDGNAIINRDARRHGLPSVAGVYSLSSFELFKKVVDNGQPFVEHDSRTSDILDEPLRALCIQLQVISFINVPVVKEEKVVGILCVVQSTPREWADIDIELTANVAERIWAAVERAKAEQALQESQKRFQSIVNLVPDSLWDSEPDGSTNWYNLRWLEYTGQSLEQAIGWGWVNAIHPDDREASAKRYSEVVKTGMPLRQEHRIRRHDGEYRWFMISASPIKDESGQVVNVYGAATDIHDRKLTEETLRKRERQLVRVQEVGNIGGVDIDVLHGLRGERSPEYLRIHGLPSDLNSETHQDWLNRIHPDDRQIAQQNLFNALKGNDSVYENEYRIIRPNDGQTRWIYAKLDIERGIDGKPVRLVGMHIDITSRKNAEIALQESEEKYRTLFDSMDEGYCIIQMIYDEEGKAVDWRYLQVNRAFELNNGLHDAEGKTIVEMAPDIEPKWMEIYDSVAQTGNPLRFQEDSDALHRIFSLYAFRIGNPEERKVAVIFTDITKRVEAEEAVRENEKELRRLVKQKEDFIAIASHELKTPVTSIKTYAEVLLERFASTNDKSSTDLMYKLEGQVDRLARLIKDLLDDSSIADGNLQLYPEMLDLNKLIEEQVEELKHLSSRHKLIFTADIIKPVKADKERISQVIVNLITNALKYAPLGGNVIIATHSTQNDVAVSVQDYGIGMPASALDKIFQRFYRVSNVKTQTFSGMGLGLYLSAEIIKKHKGSINVQSEEGKGSTFTFMLPYVS